MVKKTKTQTRWKFDGTVADHFDNIARRHIPNYEKVIEKCVKVAKTAFAGDTSIKIIDVGSATGFTMNRFISEGYTQVWGVESSPHMKERSMHKDNVILSDIFPMRYGPFDMVLANWTLHFVPDREAYMRSIYESMSDKGVCIISDKMQTSPFLVNRYHDFKRSQGVSDAEIEEKARLITGVLVPYPLEWYMQTLRAIGFSNVEVFDADWCFVSILCVK